MPYFYILVFAVFCLSYNADASTKIDSTSLLVHTKQGKLLGIKAGKVNIWRGIPYAQAPTGNLRFKLPQPPASWEGIKLADKFGFASTPLLSSNSPSAPTSEDCLFLNVWAPPAANILKPVMFWIHGGGFLTGSGSNPMYEGSQLSRNGDVVVVTINYRLGPFGFLHLDEYKSEKHDFNSNLGLHDQVAALRWVGENIAGFGGDPSNITIFGESAGAVSVLALLTSPAAKGIFSKAIIQSAYVAASVSKTDASNITCEFLQQLKISPDSISKLYELSTQELKAAADTFINRKMKESGDFLYFVPVIDGEFLPLPFDEAMKTGIAKDIPIIIGTNKDEANLFAKFKPPVIDPKEENVHSYLSKAGLGEFVSQVSALYDKYPSRNSILALATDVLFQMPSINTAESHSIFNSTYSYRFDWTSLPIRLINLGACHGMEIFFVFNSFRSKAGKMVMLASNNRKVKRLSKVIQSAWATFAHTGNPTTPKMLWEKYDSQNRYTMIFDNKTKLVSDPAVFIRKGWNEVFRLAKFGRQGSF